MNKPIRVFENCRFRFRGKVAFATVKLFATHSDTSPVGDFDFGDEKQNAEYLARFERGELGIVNLETLATFKEFKGYDSLGSCHVRTENTVGAFVSDCTDLCWDHGMVQNALDDLAANMESAYATLSEVANG